MIQIINKDACCGCTACASICTHKAITMQSDELGFFYPKVDKEICTNCNLCEKVCAFNEHYDTSCNFKEPLIFAVRHRDIHEIETSRSGAAFIAVSDYILERGGVVYGAGFTDHFKVIHKRAVNTEQRNEFKGSKYVQSDLTGIFEQVKADLKMGYTVLFSGTACQIAGLSSFLGSSLKKNLILIDIVCHGVPSPYIWRDYITYLEKKYKQKIITANFRDKTKLGWTAHKESFIFVSGKKKVRQTYTTLFFQNIMLRPSCGKCFYTNFHRPSDFTLADYWGWEKIDTNFNADNKGCSLLLVNTPRGAEIWENVKHQLFYIKSDASNCMQPNLLHPSVLSVYSDNFLELYRAKGFIGIGKKYGDLGLTNFLRNIKRRFIQ